MTISKATRLAVGVDVSTNEVRVVALDLDGGGVVARASATLPPVTGDAGRREQDADYAALASAAIERALVTTPKSSVASVSITATSGTVVSTDAHGRQRGIAVMYNDGRGAAFEQLLRHRTGRPTSMLGRIMAMAAQDPAFHAASVAQVIGTGLVGGPVAGDTSHFLKAGIDPSTVEWPEALVADTGIDRSVLPSLVQPGALLGTVMGGRAAGAALIAGMTDGCTSQLASGAVGSGQSVGVLGTTLVLKSVAESDHWDAATGVYAHRAPDGRFWLGGASNVGGGSVPLPPGLDYRSAERAAREIGPASIVRYPLARPGERFPIANPSLAAFSVDLGGAPVWEVDPVLAYRAGLEGVAFVERLGLETLDIDTAASERILSGGATRNRLWNELRAASLNAVVRIPSNADSGYGAAVLAAWGDSQLPDRESEPFGNVVARFTAGGESIEPEPALVATMAERYAVFLSALSER